MSPILVAYFTAPLIDAVSEATRHENLPLQIKNTVSGQAAVSLPTILYVDDGSLRTTSKSIEANVLIIAHGFQTVDQWLYDCGMSTHAVEIPMTQHHEGMTIQPSKSIKWLGIIFNTKLTFQEHIKAVTMQATQAVDALRLVSQLSISN